MIQRSPLHAAMFTLPAVQHTRFTAESFLAAHRARVDGLEGNMSASFRLTRAKQIKERCDEEFHLLKVERQNIHHVGLKMIGELVKKLKEMESTELASARAAALMKGRMILLQERLKQVALSTQITELDVPGFTIFCTKSYVQRQFESLVHSQLGYFVIPPSGRDLQFHTKLASFGSSLPPPNPAPSSDEPSSSEASSSLQPEVADKEDEEEHQCEQEALEGGYGSSPSDEESDGDAP